MLGFVESAIVSIMRGDQPVGAGCLVRGCELVTCAHVVRDALGLSDAEAQHRPEGTIEIRFPFLEVAATTGRVLRWFPPSTEIASDGLTDIAVIALDQPNDEVEAAQLLKVLNNRLGGVALFGFPENAPTGCCFGEWIDADAGRKLPHGWFPLWRSEPKREFVRPGFSGGPVVVETEGRIAGIVAKRRAVEEPDQEEAFAISAEVLRKALRGSGTAASAPTRSTEPIPVPGSEFREVLTSVREVCIEKLGGDQVSSNLPVDLVMQVDLLAEGLLEASREDRTPDLQQIADYNEDLARVAFDIRREGLDELFDYQPLRSVIDRLDKLTNDVGVDQRAPEDSIDIDRRSKQTAQTF